VGARARIGDDAEVNLAVLIACLLVSGCSKKSEDAPKQPLGSGGSGSGPVEPIPSGSGSGSGVAVKVVPLTWITPGGEQLLALKEDGTIDGPCGPVGKLAGGEVHIGTQQMTWSGVERKGKDYQVSPLPWTIKVGAGGDVTLVTPNKPDVPLGKVTGTETEDGANLFSALVVAAPTIQISLTLEQLPAGAGAQVWELSGSADMDAWTIKSVADKAAIATKKREDAAVSPKHTWVDGPDGMLTESGAKQPFAKLVGRKACKPHDKAVTALVETFLARPKR
jgi:hypothetical protein